jgi:hypothetical protein
VLTRIPVKEGLVENIVLHGEFRKKLTYFSYSLKSWSCVGFLSDSIGGIVTSIYSIHIESWKTQSELSVTLDEERRIHGRQAYVRSQEVSL